jgi:hypothetical protein
VIVYATGRPRGHFHKTPECDRLRAGQAGKKAGQVVGLTLDQLDGRTPCKRCYSDVPRAKIFRPYCHLCDTARPCAHNGGVAVRVPVTYRNGYALIEPGETITRIAYVSPERAYLYEALEEGA